jgi:hypothetical protein
MLTSLLIALAPCVHTPLPGAVIPLASTSASFAHVLAAFDFKDQLKAAGKDPVKLWALYQWTLEDDERKKYRKRVLKAVIKADPDHAEAREVLGHIEFEGKWYETQRSLDRHMQKIAEERGLVKYQDSWVPAVDVPFLLKGLQKDEYGDWFDPETVKRLADGWKQQDLVWVEPSEFPKMEEGLWKCGDEWKTLEQANEWHDDLDAPWVIPTKRAVIWATTTRETAMLAAKQAELAWFDMQKVFGYDSGLPVPFMVVKDQAEYLRFMDGDQDYDVPQVDPMGVSGHSRAAFADLWFDFEDSQYRGMGTTYWDAEDPNGASFGIHDARFAYGLSYVEGLDPTLGAAASVLSSAEEYDDVDRGEFLSQRFGSQRMERWFRWGAANYASRWFKDQQVGKGGNPRWAFEWSVSNLQTQGGLADLDDVFQFDVRLESDSSATLIMSAGLLVAYIVDGGNADLSRLLKQLQKGLQKGQEVGKVFEDIRKTLSDSEAEIRAFAGL